MAPANSAKKHQGNNEMDSEKELMKKTKVELIRMINTGSNNTDEASEELPALKQKLVLWRTGCAFFAILYLINWIALAFR